jgi:hypothetical protein
MKDKSFSILNHPFPQSPPNGNPDLTSPSVKIKTFKIKLQTLINSTSWQVFSFFVVTEQFVQLKLGIESFSQTS